MEELEQQLCNKPSVFLLMRKHIREISRHDYQISFRIGGIDWVMVFDGAWDVLALFHEISTDINKKLPSHWTSTP